MYIPPMIIPKKEGCCDEQKPNLPCCENVMAVYPRRRRRRRRCFPRFPHPIGDQIVEVPFPVPNVTYLDPIRVPDMVLPPMPPPPPRRPRSMMYNGQMPPLSPSCMPRRRCSITRECNITRECDVPRYITRECNVPRYDCNCGNC